MNDIIEKLKNNNNNESHQFLTKLESISSESDELYPMFDDFLTLLNDESSYVRTRGFRLCCAQAQWDIDCKIDKHLDEMLMMLNDIRPTAVRQCIDALRYAMLYKPGIEDTVKEKLRKVDLSIYNDSMRPLVERDILKIIKSW